MKLVCMSDLHMKMPTDVPSGDLLVIAGDLTSGGTHFQVMAMLQYLASLSDRFTHGVVMVAGNHDFLFQKDPAEAINLCETAGITYLCESGCMINGLNVWGSPYTPRFGGWAFMYDRHMKDQFWQRIPDDTDILITHGPPLGVMDSNFEGEHCGDEFLIGHVIERVKPKVHTFGHIHDGYGSFEYEGTTFVNCAQLNDLYELANKPVEVEI